MFLTDLVQYWAHRPFHQIPALWRFQTAYRPAKTMDWLAGLRRHLVEIACLRGFTVIPMHVPGYGDPALKTYILYVFLQSAAIHANVRLNFGWLKAATSLQARSCRLSGRFPAWHGRHGDSRH
jgi:lathosterol oxidase